MGEVVLKRDMPRQCWARLRLKRRSGDHLNCAVKRESVQDEVGRPYHRSDAMGVR
jgi:hypothetical protein